MLSRWIAILLPSMLLIACAQPVPEPQPVMQGSWERLPYNARADQAIYRLREPSTGRQILYYDTNLDGRVDQIHDDNATGGRAMIIKRDSDFDGFLDAEYVTHAGQPPRFLRGLHEPVPDPLRNPQRP